jgi:hypothetical protein
MVFVLLMVLCLVFPASGFSFAHYDDLDEEESISLEDEIYLEPHPKVMPEALNILEDIKRGQEFLRDKNAGGSKFVEEKRTYIARKKGRKKTKITRQTSVRPNFLLALKDLRGPKITSVLITSEGRVTEGFEVTKKRGTGVGSRFEIKYPENMAVLALRTTVRSGENTFAEVVYTPYSPEIDTLQVRRVGLDYLMQQIERAATDLKARKVRLNGFARLALDPMSSRIALVLSIIEHIDPTRFKACEKGSEIVLVNEVLTIIGANTTNAYAYSKSPAGARGLFQLIPDTYRRLVKRYPDSGLEKDFVRGCTDHFNAAKASLLLFDADLKSLPEKRLREVRKDASEAGRYLAASYNCGAKRVYRSAKKCKSDWTCQLPEETKVYLKKFDVVWELMNELHR